MVRHVSKQHHDQPHSGACREADERTDAACFDMEEVIVVLLHILCSGNAHPFGMTKPSAVNNQSIEPGDGKPYDICPGKALKKRGCMINLYHDKGCDENQKNDSGSLFD